MVFKVSFVININLFTRLWGQGRQMATRDTSRKTFSEIINFTLKLVVILGCYYGNFVLPFFNQFILIFLALFPQNNKNITRIMLKWCTTTYRKQRENPFWLCVAGFSNDGGNNSFGASTHGKTFFSVSPRNVKVFWLVEFSPRCGRKFCGICASFKVQRIFKTYRWKVLSSNLSAKMFWKRVYCTQRRNGWLSDWWI